MRLVSSLLYWEWPWARREDGRRQSDRRPTRRPGRRGRTRAIDHADGNEPSAASAVSHAILCLLQVFFR